MALTIAEEALDRPRKSLRGPINKNFRKRSANGNVCNIVGSGNTDLGRLDGKRMDRIECKS